MLGVKHKDMHLPQAGCPVDKEKELIVLAAVARMIDARLLETSCYSALGKGQKTSKHSGESHTPHAQIRRMILGYPNFPQRMYYVCHIRVRSANPAPQELHPCTNSKHSSMRWRRCWLVMSSADSTSLAPMRVFYSDPCASLFQGQLSQNTST